MRSIEGKRINPHWICFEPLKTLLIFKANTWAGGFPVDFRQREHSCRGRLIILSYIGIISNGVFALLFSSSFLLIEIFSLRRAKFHYVIWQSAILAHSTVYNEKYNLDRISLLPFGVFFSIGGMPSFRMKYFIFCSYHKYPEISC